MTACTDDERRRVAERLRGISRDVRFWGGVDPLHYVKKGVFGDMDRHGPNETIDRLADLIEPDTTTDTTKGIEFDAFSHGIDSIYEWCFEHLEGADGAEDELFCSIMRAIEDYRHPELATAHTVRAVDRDALLALADEMTVEKGDIWGWSSRIRKALGVES